MLETARNHVRNTKREVFLQSLTLMNGAFALIAALAWNEAIKALIEVYFPASSGLYSRFVYAIGVTILVVLAGRYISGLAKRYEENNESAQNGTV